MKQQRQAIGRRLVVFRDRHPLIGPVFWLLSVQYFITQYVVAQRWAPAYSWRFNTISDLGNTACGPYGNRMIVCSPLHNDMNASFIVLGLAMIIGSVYISSEFRKNRLSELGFTGMAIAGVGTIMVGLFPENTVAALHILGASLPFLIGNVALVIFGLTLSLPRTFKYLTLLMGLIPLITLGFFLHKDYVGLGIGGMERIVGYPQTVWLILFGLYMSMNRYRRAAN